MPSTELQLKLTPPRSRLQASVFWQRMRQLQEENQTVQVKVEGANRGGLMVKYGPYEGFVPVSQFGPVSCLP